MAWDVAFHDEFVPEFKAFEVSVQNGLLAVAKLLADYGPQLGRPHADTLKGSKHANMKELRFEGADGEWRAALSIQSGGRSCWWRGTSPGEVRSVFIVSLSPRPIPGSPLMWKA